MDDPSYLFDANAVVNLLDAADYDSLFDEATLDLMFYEATSAFWQMAAGRKKIPRELGRDFVKQLENLPVDMRVYLVGNISFPAIYELAWDTGLTAYDVAYVAMADDHDLTLVTADSGIHENAPDSVDITPTDEL